MFVKKKKINLLEQAISKLNRIMQEGNFVELSYLLGNKKEMFIRNFFAGISRGVGIGIGVTIITAILYFIQKAPYLYIESFLSVPYWSCFNINTFLKPLYQFELTGLILFCSFTSINRASFLKKSGTYGISL